MVVTIVSVVHAAAGMAPNSLRMELVPPAFSGNCKSAKWQKCVNYI